MFAYGLVHLVVSVGFSCTGFALDKLPLYKVSDGSPDGFRAAVYDEAYSRVARPCVAFLVAHVSKDRQKY